MTNYTDWSGKWSIRFAVDTHRFLVGASGSSDFTLEPCISRNKLIGYHVVPDRDMPSAWDSTFLMIRGNVEAQVKIEIPTVTPTDLEEANDKFIATLPGAGAFRNRFVRLEGDVTGKKLLESVEIFCVENVVIKQYPLMFICLDADLDKSPEGSAIAIRR